MKTRVGSWLAAIAVFLTVQNVSAFEEKYLIWDEGQGKDKWFGSIYNRDAINDSTLKVGGWGDWYGIFIQMPIHFQVPGTSRIIITRVNMDLYSLDSKNPTSMKKYMIKTQWSETSTSDQWSSTVNYKAQISAPPVNGKYSFDITQQFWDWYTGALPNYGLFLMPEDTDNKFNYFRSFEAKLEWRPRIEVYYERLPRFKMPLAGGNKAWKFTVEVGGHAYDNTVDEFHTGATYYSLDFSPRWKPVSGGAEQLAVDPPVYAMAGGVVYDISTSGSPHQYNGYYLRIDHDYDGKPQTGFQTTYIHLKNQPLVQKGQWVNQGQQVGVMGTTGASSAVHLHVTFYFAGTGGTAVGGWNDSEYLNLVKMENRLLKDYKLSTTWDSGSGQYIPIYYQSSNTE